MGNWKIVVNDVAQDLETTYGFRVESQEGTGVPPIENISTDFGLLDGALFKRFRTDVRRFTLVGTLNASSIPALHAKRADLIGVIAPDRTIGQEPIILQYTGTGGNTLQASAYYESGMELGTVTHQTEAQIGLGFVMFDPYVEGASDSQSLGVINAIADASNILQRGASGDWYTLEGGVNNQVIALAKSGGSLFVGGQFDQAGSVTNACRIATWDGNDWDNVGVTSQTTAGIPVVSAIAIAPNGDVYIGGTFRELGAVSASNIAKWNSSAWSIVDQSVGVGGQQVNALAFSNDGNLYAGGTFTGAGSATNACRIAGFDGNGWWALSGSNVGVNVYSIITDNNGNVYAGGQFTTIGSCDVAGLGLWTKSSSLWTEVGSGVNGTVRALTFTQNGTLYLGGSFTTANSGVVTACRVATWNGVGYENIADGFGSQLVKALVSSSTGEIWAGGIFENSGGLLLGGLSRFSGGRWVHPGIELPLNGTIADVQALHLDASGVLTVGFNAAASAAAAQVTTVTNNGTTKAYPKLTASGPGRLILLENYTTKQIINFDITLLTGETVTLDLGVGKKTFTSDFRGNIINTVLPSSNLATWYLASGSNSVGLLIDNSTASANLTWIDRYWSFDGS